MNNKQQEQNLIFGRNPVKEALNADRVNHVYLANGFNDQKILGLIKLHNVQCSYVSPGILSSKVNGVHQGIVAEVKPYEYLDLKELLKRSKQKKFPVLVILDGINDPHNMGAILRSCDVFDVSGVIVSKHNQVPLNGTVAKTSAGAINYVPVTLVSNINQTIDTLKENGFWIISTAGEGSLPYDELSYDFPVALVIGNEGEGVSKLVLKNSDYIVRIPEYGHINSLNASVATGILLSFIRLKNS